MITINPYKRFRGAFIPNAIMECSQLSDSAKLMWAKLAQYAGKDGRCFPSIKTLGDKTAKAERTARRALDELRDKGFIKVRRATGKSRLMHMTNEYFFLDHPVFHDMADTFSGTAKNDRSLERPEMTDGEVKNDRSLERSKMAALIEENHIKEPYVNISLSEQCSDGGFSPSDEKTEKPKKYRGTGEDHSIAKKMYEAIAVVNATVKEPNWDRWANTIRLMREQDGRTHEDVWRVFSFANRDTFWGNNVLSPEALRRHFAKLAPRAGMVMSGVRGAGADVGEEIAAGRVCGECTFAKKGRWFCGGRDADPSNKSCDLFRSLEEV